MRLQHTDKAIKGWCIGPWNAEIPLSIGYANQGIDEPHYHQSQTEIFLVARGTAQIRVEQGTIELCAGDIIVVEPGEAHTFLSSSPDYFHFVVHTPALPGQSPQSDKVMVDKSRLRM